MPETLLATKLHIPSPRPRLVPRQRLTARLDEGARGPLTLVSAPAGFGKSTLVAGWLATRALGAAWVSLDEADNDPARFLAYAIAALQKVQPALGADALNALQPTAVITPSASAPHIQALTLLLNELSALSTPVLLVLDDYHTINNPAIHEAVTFLLDNQPSALHLLLLTRADPPLPLARLRACGALLELRAADLAFTVAETTTFLHDVMDLTLTPDQVRALERRTEGWIAGLQLAALALRTPAATRGEHDVAAFIDAFTGSHRYVLDYLTSEVLARQPEHVQRFLVETSLLDKLSAPLCAAVSGRSDSQELLTAVDAANLFIIPLDDERHWYRYHHLFRDLLRQRLVRTEPDRLPALHRRAAAWYRERRWIPECVSHLLAAGDDDEATATILAHGWSFLTRGEMNTLLTWIAALPDAQRRTHPRLVTLRAWSLAFSGQLEEATVTLDTLISRNQPSIQSEIHAVRAYIAAAQGHVTAAVIAAEHALAHAPAGDDRLRSIVALCLGISYFSSAQPLASAPALVKAISLGEHAERPFVKLTAQAMLGQVQQMQGQLHEALATFHAVLSLATTASGRPIPFAGIATLGIAELRYEWNDLDGALDHARRGIELTQRGGFVSYMLAGYACLVAALDASGENDRAREQLEEMERILVAYDFGYLRAVAAGLRIRQWLAAGDLEAAYRWRERQRQHLAENPLTVERLTLAAARVHIAAATVTGDRAEADAALALLAAPATRAANTGCGSSLVKILALQALAHHSRDQLDSALAHLADALERAAPQGFVRTFLEEGPAMTDLLRLAVARGVAAGAAARLLSYGDDAPASTSLSPLADPLTDREREVLQLLVAGHTNREIAAELVIAVSTVKSHVNNIYGKLAVRNRTEASARARELYLL